jgi:zinc protease
MKMVPFRAPRTVRSGAPGPLPLLLLLHLFAPPTADGQRATLGEVMRDTVLSNGLHVIAVPNPTVPLVTIQVTVRNGAFTQLTEADEGIPHLLEHMLFRSYGSSGFGSEAGRLNARYNGTTGDETVTYYVTLPAGNLDRGVRLLADLMRAPRFDRKALQSEQRVVRGELERSVSNPTYLLGAMVDRKLWGDAIGRKNAIGNVLTINGATPGRLREIYDRFYIPNNAAVVFTGDVTPEAAFASASRHFVRWRAGTDPFEALSLPPMPPLPRNEVVVVDLEAQDVTLLIRWPGPSVREDPEASLAADVFASVLNEPVYDFQTRLVDSGHFQSVSMSYWTLAHVGPISIYATTTADQLVHASAALHREIERFSEPGYVTPEVLAVAKKRQEVDWAMYMETPSGLASFVGEVWSVAGLDYLRTYVPGIQAQREEDLETYVQTYIVGRPRVFGILISPQTRQELGPRLGEALAPWRQ